DLPPVRRGASGPLRALSMPLFAANTLKEYEPAAETSALQKAVNTAKALVKKQQTEIDKLRMEYPAPGNENQFKQELVNEEERVATLMAQLNDGLDELTRAGKERDQEPSKRSQVEYDYVLARMQMQTAFLWEYSSLLGQMRKEFPPREKDDTGWRMVPQKRMQGDKVGKDLAKSAAKILDKIVKDNPGTPWEILARRKSQVFLG